MSPFRIMWAPTILFYLGGPDTLTILALEENTMWVKHLIALITLGFRTSYVLYVSWTAELYSFLALLVLFPAMIKYGDRVWIIRSRAQGNHEGFVRMNKSGTADPQPQEGARPGRQAEEVLQAYSYFQILNSPNAGKKRDIFKKRVDSAFKTIEIELGFLYDALFSKMGSIFTAWGCILRFISISFLVSVLVLVLVMKRTTEFFKIDFPISVILIIGAIILEVAGILGQLFSDWAVVWASKYRFKLMKPIFSLQECFLKRKRWSGLMGQFDLKKFCARDEPTTLISLINALCCGNETLQMKFKLLQMEFSSSSEKVSDNLKNLVFNYLCRKSQNNSEDDQHSTVRELFRKFEESTLEFYEKIIICHIATEEFYAVENPISTTEAEAAKGLSRYMMHLLLICPRFPFCKTGDGSVKKCPEAEAAKALSRYMMYLLLICPRFPFCKTGDGFVKACDEVKEICRGKGSTLSSEAPKQPHGEEDEPGRIAEPIRNLRHGVEFISHVLKEKNNRWEIMRIMWVEILCSAAKRCPAMKHAQELRHGLEFLSHVWLLLVHRGEANWLDIEDSPSLKDAGEGLIKEVVGG
ncbi:hypothetical protein NMG60_11023247 [Bertholletia excelsa]